MGPLTIHGWFNIGESLRLQNLIKAVVRDLQDKTPIYHTVTGLQATVGHSAVMKVLHPLRHRIYLFAYIRTFRQLLDLLEIFMVLL